MYTRLTIYLSKTWSNFGICHKDTLLCLLFIYTGILRGCVMMFCEMRIIVIYLYDAYTCL
jgi:hypothetical protein